MKSLPFTVSIQDPISFVNPLCVSLFIFFQNSELQHADDERKLQVRRT